MLNIRKLTAVTLLTCLLAPAVSAQDANTVLMKKLYTKIGENVSVGSNNPTTGETFLVLANPGILLDPNLNYNTPAGRNQFARSIDKVLNPSWIYGTRNTTVFDVYNRILTDREPAEIKPTADQIKAYKKACAVIFSDCNNPQPGTYSNAFKRYQEALNALIVVSKQAEDFMRTNETQDLPPDLLAELTKATDDLDLIGNKTDIEAARAAISTFEHIDPNAWWGELAGKFRQNTETFNAARFGTLSLNPSYAVWLDMNRSWSKLTLSERQIEQTTSNSHSSIGGGGGFSLGFWSFGADYENTENRHNYEFTGRNYQLSMELTRVTIDRPWMDEGVFESHAWRWLSGSQFDKRKISSGADATQGIAPPASDIMPFIPTGLLLARRVSLTAEWSSDLKTSFDSHTSGGASVGWGPFSFSGRFDNSNDATFHKANAAGNTISFDAPQIIGFFVQVLPESPKPDRCYHFPSDTNPIPADCKDITRFFNINSWEPKVVVNSSMVLDRAKSLLREAYKGRSIRLRMKLLNL